MNSTNLELFWYWIRQRELIRIRKEEGLPRPWTGDPILQAYHFCNVHREDDRGTKEIHAVIRGYGNNFGITALPWMYTAGRMFNYAPSLICFLTELWCGGEELVRASFREMKANGNKIFHTAYVVSTCGKSIDKVDYVIEVVNKVRRLKVPCVGFDECHQVLMSVDGLGSFLAAQVVADLRNCGWLEPLGEYEAKYWSAPGPGSIKGLNYIFGGATYTTYYPLVDNLYYIMPPDIKAMNIHGQDLQNCLCEFSKYMRHLNGENGRKRYYDR